MPAILYTHRKLLPPLGNHCTSLASTMLGQTSGRLVGTFTYSKILAAGALIGPDTLARAEQQELDARKYIKNNDAYTFFKAIDDLVITGPTGTNVNDLRIILREKFSLAPACCASQEVGRESETFPDEK